MSLLAPIVESSFFTAKMPSINTALISREAMSHIAKRSSWPAQNVGVMVVFCIVGAVAIGLIFLFVSRKLSAVRRRKENN